MGNVTQELSNEAGGVRSLRRIDVKRPEGEAATTTMARLLIANALVFGLLTGGLELGLVLAQDGLSSKITMASLRTNLHFKWMIPLADVAIFGTCSLLFAWLARSRPALAIRLAFLTFTAMLALAILMRFDGLYMVARIVLSMGVAAKFGPWIQSRALNAPRLTRWSLGLLGGGLIVLIAVDFTRVATAESRTLGSLPPAAPKAPNVLFIVMDNVRAASASLNGYDRPTTPNLDRLAARGVRFEEARSTASWTLPSHAGMFTGQWHHRLSVGWDQALDRTYPTLAEHLSKQGYATAGFVGNIYYCNRRYGLDRGFARYEDYYENQTVSPYEIIRSSSLGRCLLPLVGLPVRVGFAEVYRRKSADLLNHDLLGWLSTQRDNRPFFAFVNYYDAHAPCILPEGSHRRFGHAERPQKEQIEALKRYQRLSANTLKPEDGDPKQVDREGMEILRDSYESCIAYIDAQIGRLFADLERRGMLENTMVVVTSDHGEHFNEHGFVGHGQSVYRREVHVPLLIIPPAGSIGSSLVKGVVPEPVSLRDLPATIVDLLAIRDKSPFPGTSLAPLWSSSGMLDPHHAPSPVLSEVGHKTHVPRMERIPATVGEVKALISGGKVYIRNMGAKEEVFDLRMDPLEKSNIVTAKNLNPSLQRFRSTLKQILAGQSVTPEVLVPEVPE